MGWEQIYVDGHRLVNHDGGTANFQTSIFFDPKERIGVYVGAVNTRLSDDESTPLESAGHVPARILLLAGDNRGERYS